MGNSTLSFLISEIPNIITIVIAISIIVIIIIENRNPLKAIAWIAIVSLIPIAGIVAYVMFGQDKRRKHKINRRFYEVLTQKPKDSTIQHNHKDEYAELKKHGKTINLIKKLDNSPVCEVSDIETFTVGKDMFSRMFADIREAKTNIHILSYIIEDDTLFEQLVEILKQKARENVRIRIIYDHIGSYSISARKWKELRKCGIESYPFMKVLFPILSSSINYRNHRKITVIDGRIAYVGGMNIATRYLGDTDGVFWRDTHFRLTGQTVYSLQSQFLSDWYTVSRRIPNIRKCFPEISYKTGDVMAQFICSGPIEEYKNIEQTIISLISRATDRIYIQTPYLLPTSILNNALISASLSGIKVEIMIPDKGDNKITSWAIDSFLSPLLQSNIKIYRYKKGFLHSKLMMIDGDVSVIGSPNMDFRSFEYNFEIIGVVYNCDFCKSLEQIFDADKKDCVIMDIKEWEERSNFIKLRDGIMRLFSPLL